MCSFRVNTTSGQGIRTGSRRDERDVPKATRHPRSRQIKAGNARQPVRIFKRRAAQQTDKTPDRPQRTRVLHFAPVQSQSHLRALRAQHSVQTADFRPVGLSVRGSAHERSETFPSRRKRACERSATVFPERAGCGAGGRRREAPGELLPRLGHRERPGEVLQPRGQPAEASAADAEADRVHEQSVGRRRRAQSPGCCLR